MDFLLFFVYCLDKITAFYVCIHVYSIFVYMYTYSAIENTGGNLAMSCLYPIGLYYIHSVLNPCQRPELGHASKPALILGTLLSARNQFSQSSQIIQELTLQFLPLKSWSEYDFFPLFGRRWQLSHLVVLMLLPALCSGFTLGTT